MKFTLLAATVLVGLAAGGARAGEEYPTPITRPIYSSVPVLDVGGGGPWSKTTVVTGSGGYTAAASSEGMPVAPSPAPASPTYVQRPGAISGSHG